MLAGYADLLMGSPFWTGVRISRPIGGGDSEVQPPRSPARAASLAAEAPLEGVVALFDDGLGALIEFSGGETVRTTCLIDKAV